MTKDRIFINIIESCCERFGWIRLTNQTNNFSSISKPIDHLNCEYTFVSEVLKTGGLHNDFLMKHVKQVSCKTFPSNFTMSPLEFVAECLKAYPKSKNYSLKFEKLSDKEISCIAKLLDFKLPKLNIKTGSKKLSTGIQLDFENKYICIVDPLSKPDDIISYPTTSNDYVPFRQRRACSGVH